MAVKKVASTLRNQKGQLLMEAVLLMTVLVSVMILVTRTLKEQGFVQEFTQQPWRLVSGMIESGVWTKESQEAQRALHPNHLKRHYSNTGDRQ